jgi:GDPmannose 4,6-dehydratase
MSQSKDASESMMQESGTKAIITGITGQDGSYLAEFLLSRGYEVHGTVRQASFDRLERISHIVHRVRLHSADLLDQLSVVRLVDEVRPDEIYNLAGQTPQAGWQQPLLCAEINALGASRILETIRLIDPEIRFFQASSSDMFGRVAESPQTEHTPFSPLTPYGAAKLHAHWSVVNYRERYGLKASCGILYDHESPRRGIEHITRRITHGAARVKLGLQEKLSIETLDIQRDWGFAGDFVRAFWMILQQPTPEDYIIAAGRTHTLEDFCRLAFEALDLDWRDHVVIDDPRFAQAVSAALVGDISRAQRQLRWEPEVSFAEMIAMMVEADCDRYSPKKRLQTAMIDTDELERSLR